jgi:hypothetical protein
VPRQKSEPRSQRAPDCPAWHRTVRCRKKTKLQRSTELRTLTVGDVAAHRTAHNTCPVAHRTVQCAHRQQPPQRLWKWLQAINTPQPVSAINPKWGFWWFNDKTNKGTNSFCSQCMIRKQQELKEASRTSCNERIKFYVNLELHDVIFPYYFSHR